VTFQGTNSGGSVRDDGFFRGGAAGGVLRCGWLGSGGISKGGNWGTTTIPCTSLSGYHRGCSPLLHERRHYPAEQPRKALRRRHPSLRGHMRMGMRPYGPKMKESLSYPPMGLNISLGLFYLFGDWAKIAFSDVLAVQEARWAEFSATTSSMIRLMP
jgi:hypothetical protein